MKLFLFVSALFLSFEPISHAVIIAEDTSSSMGDFARNRLLAEDYSIQAIGLYQCALQSLDHGEAVVNLRQAIAASTQGLVAEATGSHPLLVDETWASLVALQVSSYYQLARRVVDSDEVIANLRQALAVSTAALSAHAARTHALVPRYEVILVTLQAKSHYLLAIQGVEAVANLRRAIAASTTALAFRHGEASVLSARKQEELIVLQSNACYELAQQGVEAVVNLRQALAASTAILKNYAARTHPLTPANWARLVTIQAMSYYQLASRGFDVVVNLSQALAVSTAALNIHAAGIHFLTHPYETRLLTLQSDSRRRLEGLTGEKTTSLLEDEVKPAATYLTM